MRTSIFILVIAAIGFLYGVLFKRMRSRSRKSRNPEDKQAMDQWLYGEKRPPDDDEDEDDEDDARRR